MSSAVTGVQVRIQPGGETTVSVHTLADATCALHEPGDADPAHQLRLYSDDAGVVRIAMRHLDPTHAHGQLDLACADDGGAQRTHRIDVVLDAHAQTQTAEPFDRSGKPTLPALDVPAMSLTDAEITARHYPPRPNPTTNPVELQSWLDLVNSGATVVAPHIIEEPDVSHSVNAISGNWSGYVLSSPASAPIYPWIYGEWNVPRVYPESGFTSNDHSSFWVGIDGWGSNDVVQDGTDQNTLTMFWIQVASYDAWEEWYPLPSQVISNFPVNPGDLVDAWTLVKDSAGNYTSHPTVGWFYMWNHTQNVYQSTTINIPAGASFSGHSAEWVMERPTVNGVLTPLANYSAAAMTNALAYDLWGGTHYYGGDATDTSWNVTMTGNSGAPLSTVAPVTSSKMSFTFHAHQ